MRIHGYLLALVLPLLLAAPVSAQEWARKMFDTTSHDFGTVARGAKSTFRFKFKNIYKETIHVSSVRTSCKCTIPKINNATLATYEEGSIDCEFNTRSFLGHRDATVTVTIDQPFRAEVQLHVSGNIRSDIVFDPGSVQFGEVDQGTVAEKRVQLNYAGRSDWQVVDVQSAGEYFEVEMSRRQATQGRVSYDLTVRLIDSAPAGYISDQLFIVTNDQRSGRIPLAVEGRVVSDVTVIPAKWSLGDVPVGRPVTKQLVVKSKRPFRIVNVDCDDGCFSFDVKDESKKLHLVAVTFTPKAAGKVEKQIRITTDRSSGVATSLRAYANVIEAATETSSRDPAATHTSQVDR